MLRLPLVGGLQAPSGPGSAACEPMYEGYAAEVQRPGFVTAVGAGGDGSDANAALYHVPMEEGSAPLDPDYLHVVGGGKPGGGPAWAAVVLNETYDANAALYVALLLFNLPRPTPLRFRLACGIKARFSIRPEPRGAALPRGY